MGHYVRLVQLATSSGGELALGQWQKLGSAKRVLGSLVLSVTDFEDQAAACCFRVFQEHLDACLPFVPETARPQTAKRNGLLM